MEQKKFDVNSFIGMILLGGIIFWWMSTQEPEVDAANKTTTTETVDTPETINNTSTAFFDETTF
jgi:YidC/Oxa1 family membrane protein insertase